MNQVTTYLSAHAKFIAALVGAVLAIVAKHYGAGSDLYFDLVTLAAALGVYAVPNEPK